MKKAFYFITSQHTDLLDSKKDSIDNAADSSVCWSLGKGVRTAVFALVAEEEGLRVPPIAVGSTLSSH
jgi:hypothetical protein